MDNKKLWDGVLVEMELSVSKANFATWFKDTFIHKLEDGVVFISVPNAFVKEWLFTKYHNNILKALRKLSDNIRSLDYMVSKDGKKPPAQDKKTSGTTRELPLNDFYINKEDNLNPKYTFSNFIVGPFNELAYAAAQAIIKKPGSVYNPLFIYGNTGHGKTHLIQAVGNHLKQNGTNRRIMYITSERFLNDYVNSMGMGQGRGNDFKEKYRKYDILIMDDIQFLSGKDRTQEELFHLFNFMHENNKQIIFSSDKHPNYIPNLEDRLKSRFGAGMIVDIPSPDHESRSAIIKAKLIMNNFSLASEIVDYLAGVLSSNIRELEGAINTIICQTQLKNRELNMNEIRNLIKDTAKPKKTMSPKEIIKIVTDFYRIEENAVYEKTRKKEVIKPRQIIMYLLREDLQISYPSIGEKLGGRDHTTVMHSCEKVKDDIQSDTTLAQEISELRAMMQ